MVSSILQVLGLSAISIGLGLLLLPVGIISAGVSLVLIGIAMERSNNAG